MIKIAHRGNYAGKDAKWENHPSYIGRALREGYDVEVDLWVTDQDDYYLGHDGPQYFISDNFLWEYADQLWIHTKNLRAFRTLGRMNAYNVFWHDKDDFTFTSRGFKWANAGIITHDGIMVMPEYVPGTIEKITSGEVKPLGVCSDDFSVFDVVVDKLVKSV